MTITSPLITRGARVYALLGNSSRVLGTATENGRVTVTFSEDPVIIVEAGPPVVEVTEPAVAVATPGIVPKLAITGVNRETLISPAAAMVGFLVAGIGLVVISRRRSRQSKFL
jgi:hypothetical protein